MIKIKKDMLLFDELWDYCEASYYLLLESFVKENLLNKKLQVNL